MDRGIVVFGGVEFGDVLAGDFAFGLAWGSIRIRDEFCAHVGRVWRRADGGWKHRGGDSDGFDFNL